MRCHEKPAEKLKLNYKPARPTEKYNAIVGIRQTELMQIRAEADIIFISVFFGKTQLGRTYFLLLFEHKRDSRN